MMDRRAGQNRIEGAGLEQSSEIRIPPPNDLGPAVEGAPAEGEGLSQLTEQTTSQSLTLRDSADQNNGPRIAPVLERSANTPQRIQSSVRCTLTGVGQIMLCDNPLSGGVFLSAIALQAPLLAVGAAVGSAIGSLSALLFRYDKSDIKEGLYGFNASLVGIATFVKFDPSVASVSLMCVGAVLSTVLMNGLRQASVPALTAPFIVATWALWRTGEMLQLGSVPEILTPLSWVVPDQFGTLHGLGQVLFQDSSLVGVACAVALFISSKRAVAAGILGSLAGGFAATVMGASAEAIGSGLFGYNAALCAIALKDRSSAPAAVALTFPIYGTLAYFGVPALTAPFVVATWLAMWMFPVKQKAEGQ